MKTANEIKIPIHSMVELITNSSSEVFVYASESTVKAIKDIINSLLILGGAKATCDDLFDVYLKDLGGDTNVIVKVKEGVTDENAKTVENLLSCVTNLFSLEGTYNG